VAAPGRPRLLAPEFDAERAVALILQSYNRYLNRMAGDDPEDPKSVVGLHAAGRAVLAHAEHLLKVAGLVGAGAAAAPDLAALVAEARANLGADDSDEENDSDDPVGGQG
jgi:hypothetical protein